MSYEGHIQLLCKKGHPDELPVTYDMYGDDGVGDWRCQSLVNNKPCKEPVGWSNSVDDTNFESWGHHEMIELTPEETKVCDLGHTHVLTAATFKPSENPFWYHQEWDWMEIQSLKCPECGDDATKSVCKEDPSKTILDCGPCHNRKVLEDRQKKSDAAN